MSTQISMTGRLDPRDSWVAERCPMAATLDVVSTRTAFLVLREAFYGATRFDQFVSRTGISEPVAAARLKELETAGLLERRPYQEPGQRTRHEYALTEKGRELGMVVGALAAWGGRHVHKQTRLVHTGCGHPVSVGYYCPDCGEGVRGADVTVTRARSRRGTRAPRG